MPNTFRFTATAEQRPYHCVAYPGLGRDHPKGYVRLGHLSGFDNDAFVSVEALHAIAREVPETGLASKDDLAALQAENDQLKAALEDALKNLAEAETEMEAIDLLARKDGQYIKQKRTGRPPKDAKEKVTADGE